MLDYLKGTLAEVTPTRIVVDVGGMGYDIFVPLSTFDRLPRAESEVRLLTYLHHRDDQMTLYGFMTGEEREIFRMLISISGIGPKAALGVLSGIGVDDFRGAVAAGDAQRLRKVQGIGPKMASRIVVERKESVGESAKYSALVADRRRTPAQQRVLDAVSALIQLGYNQSSAHKAIKGVVEKRGGKKLQVEEIVKRALKHV